MANEDSLSGIFRAGQELYEKIENINLTSSNTIHQDVNNAILHFSKCAQLVDTLSLFSSNETVDDINTKDLRFLLVDFYLGDLTSKLTNGDRIQILNTSKRYFEQFLHKVELHEILKEEDQKYMERADVINKDPAMKRQEKIARYKREKETKAKLEKLQQLLSSIENDNDKEDIDRNCVLTCIDLFIQKSIEQLSSINQEMDLLNNMRKSEDHIKQSGVNEKEIVPSTNTLKDGNGPLLSSEGRPLRPFIITSKREEIRQQVFRPGWRLPTMTIDEYLQQEKERGNIISGGGQMPEKKEINDNDEEAIDAETYRLRELDEFKDVNPRGWGNRMGKG